jgi:hypothetical protein
MAFQNHGLLAFLRRVSQTDPIGFCCGLKWYAYVGGDAVSVRDPNGLSD